MRKRSTSLLLSLLLSVGLVFGQYAPQQVATQPSTQSPEPAIDCNGHADGLYVRDPNQCLDGFYKCANNRSFYYRCPTGLFFSIEDAQCEYRQLIPACGGQRPVEASASAPVQTVQIYQPTTQAPQQQPSYAQTTQAPVYTQPPTTQAPIYTQPPTTQAPVYTQPPTTQAPVYTQPPTTQAPVYTQPPAPVYVQPQTTQAPYVQPQTVPSYQISYGGNAPMAPTPQQYNEYTVVPPQAPVAPSQPVYQQYGSNVAAPPAPQLVASTQPPVDFNCGPNQEGYYYKQQCTSNYYSCNGGIATKLTCPGGTVYDPLIHGCDYPDVCGRPRPSTTTTAQPLVNYGYGWQTSTQSTECAGKIDGFYARGHCVKEYLHCSHGIAFALKCPSGLVFKKDSCAYLSDCLSPTVAPPVAIQQQQPTPPPLTWCRDHQKSDGYHADGCSSTYYSCNAGFTQKLTCPASLVFDSQSNICEERQYASACGGRPRPPTTTTIPTPVAAVQRPNFNCQGKPDAYYTKGCSGTYFVCVGGIATQQLNCPSGLAYDETTSACDQPQFVPACGGKPTTTTPSPPPVAVQRPNFNCQGKQDDYYTNGCSSTYFVCVGGIATQQLNCPSGLAYDTTTRACEEARYVPACGGRPATTTPAAPVAPVIPPNFNCQGQTGYFASNGCVNVYYYCNSGTPIEVKCPTGTNYSPHLHACDYRSNIPECGGQLPTTTQQAPIAVGNQNSGSGQYGYAPQPQATQAPYQPPQYVQQTTQPPAPVYVQPTTQPPAPVYVQPTTQPPAPVYVQPTTTLPPQTPAPYSAPAYQQQAQQPVASQPSAPVSVAQPGASSANNQCAHLQNGIYGRRCSRHYFVCTDHKIFEFTCPSGFAYDRTIARCGPLSQIQGCDSVAGPVPPAAQPQSEQPQFVQPPASPPAGFFRIRK